MRNGATSMRKSPAHDFVQTRSALAVIASDSACHAGGRGFESRRSRLGTANKKRFLLGATPLRDAKGAYRCARTVAAAHSRLLVREGRPHAGVLVVARRGVLERELRGGGLPLRPLATQAFVCVLDQQVTD
jgi:hypothetical protein